MTPREKIIVGVMCLTLAYGAYELVGGRTPKRTDAAPARNTPEELRTFVTDMSQKLMTEKVIDEHRHLIRQAAAGWNKDPFIASSLPLKSKLAPDIVEKSPAEPRQRMEIVYTGFMDMGGVRMAIINGMEYTTGEALDIKGYYVKTISPRHVILGKNQSMETIELPLLEAEPGPEEKER
jgi:hypothetical protein